MATNAETYKIAKETGWATLVRQLAHRLMDGDDPECCIAELTRMRKQEQESIDRETQYAALGRQIGDANAVGKPLLELLDKIVALRRKELGGPVAAELPATVRRTLHSYKDHR